MSASTRRPPVEPLDEPTALVRRYRNPIPRYTVSQPEPVVDSMFSLLTAFDFLMRRGVGPNAWARSFSNNPLAFMLDTMQDGVRLLRNDGTVVYQNRAAELLPEEDDVEVDTRRFSQDGTTFERRRMRYSEGDREVTVEIISKVR